MYIIFLQINIFLFLFLFFNISIERVSNKIREKKKRIEFSWPQVDRHTYDPPTYVTNITTN